MTCIEWINEQKALKISLDIPSGLDADSGKPPVTCVRANATLSLALSKVGLMITEAKRYSGDLYIGDISVPSCLLQKLRIVQKPVFSKNCVIRIR